MKYPIHPQIKIIILKTLIIIIIINLIFIKKKYKRTMLKKIFKWIPFIIPI